MRFLVMIGAILSASVAAAQDAQAVIDAANAAFDRMPVVEQVAVIEGRCGATAEVNKHVAYCTSENRIFLTATGPEAAYLLAHVYGHAVQVRHGVADVALRTIQRRRAEEATLRLDVTRMVECIAGVILHRAGVDQVDLTGMFATDPLSDSHWGRKPLSAGPRVTMTVAERNSWLQRGLAEGHPRVCGTVSFPADLVVAAFRD